MINTSNEGQSESSASHGTIKILIPNTASMHTEKIHEERDTDVPFEYVPVWFHKHVWEQVMLFYWALRHESVVNWLCFFVMVWYAVMKNQSSEPSHYHHMNVRHSQPVQND